MEQNKVTNFILKLTKCVDVGSKSYWNRLLGFSVIILICKYI